MLTVTFRWLLFALLCALLLLSLPAKYGRAQTAVAPAAIACADKGLDGGAGPAPAPKRRPTRLALQSWQHAPWQAL